MSRISELDADERYARHSERLQRKREAYRQKREANKARQNLPTLETHVYPTAKK
jgi:hypothetical protein